jgi:ribosomal protein S21
MGKHPVNVCVERREGESDEKFIKRFMRKCRKEEITREVMDRRYHKKPSEKRRQKEERAAHRRRIEERRQRRSGGGYDRQRAPERSRS